MNDFLFYCREALALWLDKYLPRDDDGWWQRRVLDNITEAQRAESESLGDRDLRDLELWTLVRVALGSWDELAGFSRSPAEAEALLVYMRVMGNGMPRRSFVADSIEDTIGNFKMIGYFLEAFDGDPGHLSEVEKYIEELKGTPDDKGLSDDI